MACFFIGAECNSAAVTSHDLRAWQLQEQSTVWLTQSHHQQHNNKNSGSSTNAATFDTTSSSARTHFTAHSPFIEQYLARSHWIEGVQACFLILRSNSLSAVGTLQLSEQSAGIMCVALMPVSAPLPTSVVMLAIMASAQNPQLQNVKHQQQRVGTSPQDVLVAANVACKQPPPSLQHQ